MPRTPLVFPRDMRQAAGGRAYPYIAFSYYDNQFVPGDVVFLPMPPALEISDSMEYNTIDLGIVGSLMSDTIEGSMAGIGKAYAASIKGGFDAFLESSKEKIKSTNAAAAASIAMRYTPGGSERVANVVDFASKQILAPNRNTTFQGSNIRSYNFKFKLVARDREESRIIKEIVNTFRENLYPEGDSAGVIMSYPGTWKIHFCREDMANNNYLPQIFRCYMTSFGSMYNSSNNMWHDDGSPVEVDVNMTFTEVKALNKQDIVELNSNRGDIDLA